MKRSNNLHEVIAQSDRALMSIDIKGLPADLYQGKMGLCIYFFHASRLLQNHQYRVFAENLLTDIYSSIKHASIIDFDKGISGIGWGIHHLIKNGFVTGNPNHILQDTDNLIYQELHFDWLSNKEKYRIDFLRLLFYYSERLRTFKDPIEITLAQRTVIRIINHIEDHFANIPWSIPQSFNIERYEMVLYLCLLSRIYQQGFYNYKIVKIWDNLSSIILSTIPVLHVNRLLLSLGIQKVLECVNLLEWKWHKKLLDEHIDHEKIVSDEFLNKNVTLRRGLSGYCSLLLIQRGKLAPFVVSHILQKFENSDVWTGRFNSKSVMCTDNLGLLDGYAGVALMYQFLQKV